MAEIVQRLVNDREALMTVLGELLDDRLAQVENRLVTALSARRNDDSPSSIPRMVSIRELTDRLGVDERTIRRWVRSGEFPSPTHVGACLRWPTPVIEEWLALQRINGATDAGTSNLRRS